MEDEEFTIYRREESSECLVYAPTTNLFVGYGELLRIEKKLIELGFVITRCEVPYIQCIDTNYEGGED